MINNNLFNSETVNNLLNLYDTSNTPSAINLSNQAAYCGWIVHENLNYPNNFQQTPDDQQCEQRKKNRFGKETEPDYCIDYLSNIDKKSYSFIENSDCYRQHKLMIHWKQNQSKRSRTTSGRFFKTNSMPVILNETSNSEYTEKQDIRKVGKFVPDDCLLDNKFEINSSQSKLDELKFRDSAQPEAKYLDRNSSPDNIYNKNIRFKLENSNKSTNHKIPLNRSNLVETRNISDDMCINSKSRMIINPLQSKMNTITNNNFVFDSFAVSSFLNGKSCVNSRIEKPNNIVPIKNFLPHISGHKILTRNLSTKYF